MKQHIRVKPSERVFRVVNGILLSVVALLCLYPMLYVAFASFSDSNLLMTHTGLLFKPLGFNLNAYKRVFENPMIVSGYKNTLILLVVGVTLQIAMTSIAAYVLSRKNLLWRNTLMMLITFTMFFSGGMIPFYLNLQQLHLTDTRAGLIVPFLVNTYNMIILRTSFQEIPESLFEAAYIDGASHMRVLSQIVIPLSKSVLAVMVLYYGVGVWNGWFWASTILRDRSLLPLQVVLREILISSGGTQEMTTGVSAGDTESIAQTIKYATIMVATVPILAIYPFLQRYFESGVMIGAVKE